MTFVFIRLKTTTSTTNNTIEAKVNVPFTLCLATFTLALI